MSSPAERYAAARRRAAQASAFPALDEFSLDLGFDLDDFQREACEALERGSGVLVCAPTGAGKTVVGEFAVHLALRGRPGGDAPEARRKCFYTTPIKALSNQKYHDLVDRYGAEHVGLLTGDNAINGDAPVVVMTTEVLRNMLYAGSATLKGLAYVVMDEVHYLADRFRGGVWEEVIIHLPESVTLVSLSATVSNAEEFADWLVTVRGETAVVVSEHRPVPLWQHMLVGKRMFDLFHDADAARKHDVHPELLRYTRDTMRRLELGEGRSAGPGGGRRGPRWRGPMRPDIVDRLDREGLLPAILFIFSRAGCDAAVQQCLAAGLRLTSAEERAEIRRVVESKVTAIPGEDLSVLGYWEWLDGLERGLAAHHAGMLPAFKEVGRGAVRPRAGQGRLRHRDAGAGHQHAGPLRGAGTPGQVQRRGARRPHPGRVHPAHRPGRPPRHRRRGPRGGGLVAGDRPPARRRARLHPHLSAALQLPAVVQHGRQPGRQRRRGARAGAAGVLVRAVPGRPVGGRPGPAGAAQHRDHRGVRRGGRLPPRRLRRVLRAAGGDRRPGTRHRPAGRRPSARPRPWPRWSGCGSAT